MKATVACALCIPVLAAGGRAADAGLESAGVRSGFSGHTSAKRFLETEGFAKWNLIHTLDLQHHATFDFQLETAAGWLTGRGEDAFVGSVGPAIRFGGQEVPVAFVAGSLPTLLSRDEFGDKNFGIPFQFISYLGLEVRAWSHLNFGYRFQHMSNAGLSSHNPGLNLHMFGLSYAF